MLLLGKKANIKLILDTDYRHHSSGSAVVKPIVVELLHRLKEVQSFTNARRDRGGEGALEVFLA